MSNSITFPTNGSIKNFVFLGEAGCGKSEIALNLALLLSKEGAKVHFFDLDMTKPLFRSRDKADFMSHSGVNFTYEEQFADAPTTVGGVRQSLLSDEFTLLDVGGDYIGARALGAYAPLLKGDKTRLYYVINSFRPWSDELNRVDGVLSGVLNSSRLGLEDLHFIGNPNLGADTTPDDIIRGTILLNEMLEGIKEVEFICAEGSKSEAVQRATGMKVFPIMRYLAYPWE